MSFSRVRGSVGLASLVVSSLLSTYAYSAEWVGANGLWGSVSPTVPGWSTLTAPNGVGEVAEKVDNLSGTATIDAGFGPVTLGRVTMGGPNAFSFGVTPTAGLTLNQDGPGGLPATISNINTSGGSTAVILNAGPVTLADDLLISNTSNSIRTTGAIIISSTIDGVVPSVTIENVTNTFPLSTTSFAGAVRIQTGVNTFQAPVTITKGLVTFNNNSSFGDATNSLTIGQTGAGLGATVLSTAAVIIPQNITIAGGTGGTTIVGSNSTSNAIVNFGYSGSILLNGDLTTTGASLVGTGPNFSGNITGAGGITHFGNAAGGLGNATLSGANDYAGATTINSGTLHFGKRDSLYNGMMASWTTGNLTVNAGGVASFYVGGTDDFTAADIQHLSGLGNGVGGFRAGSGLGFNTSNGDFAYSSNITNTNGGVDSLGLVKYGLNTLTVSGTNTYTGPTVVAQGILHFGKRASFYNGNTADWTDTNLTVSAGTGTATVFNGATAAFSVGGADEFTAADIDLIKGLGTATGGFTGTNVAAATASNLGFDTTNAAGGTFVYGSNIANPNGGVNPMGITKLGTGTLELTGTNTYSGMTIVDGGTLRLNGGSHVVDPSVVVTSTIGNYVIGSTASADGHLIIDGTNITSDNGMMVGHTGKGSLTLNSGTVILKADNTGGEQFLGIGRFAGSEGTYVQNGGELLVGLTGNSDWFVVGRDGKGTATLNAGDIKSSTFALAQGITGDGTFNINGGTVTTSANMYVVAGTATINQTAGDLVVGTWLTLGEAATAVATYNISGGTMSTGNVATENFVLGFNGTATVNQTGGDIIVRPGGGDLNMGWQATGSGTYNISAGTVTANSNIFIGINGIGVLNQTGGTITASAFSSLARGVSGTGTYNMSGGTSTWNSDLNVGDYGQGFLNQTGGTINAGAPIFGWQTTGVGTGVIDGANAILNATGTGGVYVGNNGTGVLDLKNGQINVTNAAGDFRIANAVTGLGTFNQTGGAVVVSDQTYVGLAGIGAYNLSGGTYEAGDNVYIGLNAGSSGTMTQTGGTVTIIGNEPSFTGNLIVGNTGTGTLNMDGGLIDMVVTDLPDAFDTLNSLSYSIANNTGPGTEFLLAQDGNLHIGRNANSSGIVNQTAGTINVAANVIIGTGDLVNDVGATGTLNISGGTMTVGTTSPTGGDLALGGSSFSVATVNLSGGTLDVTSGSGKIGAGQGTVAFNFTGGTLKAIVYNAGDYGGTLGALVQNGAGSHLDASGNNTQINHNYDLGEGTATVGTNYYLSAGNIINSAGAGVINVGTGGGALEGDWNGDGSVNAADFVVWRDNPTNVGGGNPAGYNTWRQNFGATGGGSPGHLTVAGGTIDVDTLNLDNGMVTAGGGVTVRTALTGTGSFSDNLTLVAGSTVTMAIDGSAAGTEYDQIDVGGILAVAGSSLQVNVGFTPTLGQQFNLFDFAGGSISGLFSSVNFSAGNWITTQLYTDGIVQYNGGLGSGSATGVPEPATWALLAMGFVGLFGARSVRNRRK